MQRLPALARSLAILLLVTGLAASAAAQAGTDQEAHVELILDASGSMFNRLEDGRYRIVAAKEVLAELIAALPANANLNVGYRAYGSELQATAAGSCEDSKLLVPIEGVQRQQLLDTVKGTQARGATPIAYSLQLALNDLEGRAGKKVVVLITDGEEGCAGDVRAAAEALTAAGIDLRIIGFDLNEYARAAFQGLGVFENLVLRDQTFHADLPAGAYVAKVSDAHSAEPLTITGLTVTPEGPNAFEFELAPRLDVVITPATSTPNAGATLTVAWEGAPDVRNGYIALAPTGEDIAILYMDAPGSSGEGEIRLPSQPGDYDLRYQLDQPNGSTDLLGLTSISLQSVAVTLDAPAEAVAGGYLPVTWEGPDNQYDFITIVPASAEGFTWMAYQETASGNPLELRVPTEAGDYEVRYLDGYSNETLGSIPLVVTEATAAFTAPTEAVAGSIIILDVTAATATVSAPATVGAGQPFDVTWEGPGNMGDFVTIVPAGTGEGEWGYSIDVGNGSPTELYAPDEPGEYEVRYVTGQLALTLARTPITVR